MNEREYGEYDREEPPEVELGKEKRGVRVKCECACQIGDDVVKHDCWACNLMFFWMLFLFRGLCIRL